MKHWLELIIWVLIPTIIISQVIARKAQARQLREMWATIAQEYGWQYELGRGVIKAKLTSHHQGRDFQLFVYINYQTRNAPSVYTEIALSVEKLDELILRSNWSNFTLLSSLFNSTQPILWKLKSGDAIFDGSFGFNGTPFAQAEALLHCYDVRAAIRKLYPMNVAIFEPPTLNLQNGQLQLRTYRLHEQKPLLEQFIHNACHLAEILEIAAGEFVITDVDERDVR